MGRDKEYEEMERLLRLGTPVVLNGVAGIGKTTLCSYYYKKHKERNPQFFMLYIDISGCRGVESFSHLLSSAINLDSVMKLDFLMEYLINHKNNYQVILFDNWEEFQCSMVNTASWDVICNYITFLAANGINILISSQEKIMNGWKEIPLNELQMDDGRKLFELLLLNHGKKLNIENANEYQAFEYLLKCMDNHPLTIILTASLIEGANFDLNRIKNRWAQAFNQTAIGRHRSLRTAFKMTYDEISNVEGAALLWGILSKLTSDFPIIYMDLLKELFSDIDWEEAERILVRRCLVGITEIQSLHMLIPVKQQWESLSGNTLKKICLEKWGDLLPAITQIPNGLRNANISAGSHLVMNEIFTVLNDFLQIIKDLLNNNMVLEAEKCILAMEPYYELIGKQGRDFLEILPLESFSTKTKGYIYRCRADITRMLREPNVAIDTNVLYEMALSCYKEKDSEYAFIKNTMGLNYMWNYGDVDQSLACFKESERLSRSNGYDICLAEALKNKGILLSNELELYDDAKACFEEAEELYKRTGNDRGLAHVIKRIGAIEWKKGNIDLAIKHYEKALPLYQRAQYIQGMADTISRLCEAYAYKGDKSKLSDAYEAGNDIYDYIPYEVTRKDLRKNMDLAKRMLGN